MMDPRTVPLINEDCFDSSKTVTHKLGHTVNTQQQIARLASLLKLDAHPRINTISALRFTPTVREILSNFVQGYLN